MGSGANAGDARFAAATIPEPLLFNLADDPNEMNDVFAKYPQKAGELAERLKAIGTRKAGSETSENTR